MHKTQNNNLPIVRLAQPIPYNKEFIAGQIAPEHLRSIIIKKLDKLKSSTLNESYWKDLLEALKKENSELISLTVFFQGCLGELSKNYRFPMELSSYNYNNFNLKNLTTSPSNTITCLSLDPLHTINLSVFIHYNYYQVLAYLLEMSKNNEDLAKYLKKYNFKKDTIKFILKDLNSLYKTITQHIRRKTSECESHPKSITNLEKSENYFKFWNKECSKRRFLSDYQTCTSTHLSKYLESMQDLGYIFCYGCPLHSSNLDMKKVFDFKYSFECTYSFCFTKKVMCAHAAFNAPITNICLHNENETIYQKYNYHLPDLLCPLPAEKILSYYNKNYVPPYFDQMETEIYKMKLNAFCKDDTIINFELQSTGSYKSLIDCRHQEAIQTYQENKQEVDNESFIIGVHFWDKIFLATTKISFREHVRESYREDSAISELIKNKFKENLSSSDDNTGDTEFSEILVRSCWRHYIRVKETILNEKCKLLNIEEALKRHSERKKR